jgi:hypothetical protein
MTDLQTRDWVKLGTSAAILLAVTVLCALDKCTMRDVLDVVFLLAPSPTGSFASMLPGQRKP